MDIGTLLVQFVALVANVATAVGIALAVRVYRADAAARRMAVARLVWVAPIRTAPVGPREGQRVRFTSAVTQATKDVSLSFEDATVPPEVARWDNQFGDYVVDRTGEAVLVSVTNASSEPVILRNAWVQVLGDSPRYLPIGCRDRVVEPSDRATYLMFAPYDPSEERCRVVVEAGLTFEDSAGRSWHRVGVRAPVEEPTVKPQPSCISRLWRRAAVGSKR